MHPLAQQVKQQQQQREKKKEQEEEEEDRKNGPKTDQERVHGDERKDVHWLGRVK